MACFDTDFLVDLLRMDPKARAKLEEIKRDGGGLRTTPISACELFEGAFLSSKPSEAISRVRGLLERLEILDFDIIASETFGMLSTDLRKKGNTIEDFDLSIASIAISRKEILVTRNTKHFSRIKGLLMDSW